MCWQMVVFSISVQAVLKVRGSLGPGHFIFSFCLIFTRSCLSNITMSWSWMYLTKWPASYNTMYVLFAIIMMRQCCTCWYVCFHALHPACPDCISWPLHFQTTHQSATWSTAVHLPNGQCPPHALGLNWPGLAQPDLAKWTVHLIHNRPSECSTPRWPCPPAAVQSQCHSAR